MIDDLFTSIKAYLYDRTSSPLLGAIVTGLFIWNFKILILVFSSSAYAVKMWEIDHFYSQTFFVFKSLGYEHWVFSNYVFCIYLLPLVTAIFYIFIFPEMSIRVFRHSYEKRLQLIEVKKKLQGSAILTEDDRNELLQRLEDSKKKYRVEKINFSEQTAAMELQLDESKAKLEKIQREHDDLIIENRDLKLKVTDLETVIDNLNKNNSEEQSLENAKDAIGKLRSDLEIEPSVSSQKESDFFDRFENSSSTEQRSYIELLSKLFLRPLNYSDYNGDSKQFDKYMPTLILYNMVRKQGENTYKISREGHDFYKKIVMN